MKLTFIGGGNMASALIGGLLSHGYSRSDMQVVEVSSGAREKIERVFALKAFSQIADAALGDCVLLAVKPQQLRAVATEIASLIGDRLVISIAAGVRTQDLSLWLKGCQSIVRVMPNTPALVRSGISALYAMPSVDEAGRVAAEKILSAVGTIFWLDDESQMDAVTALSGSGPAYVYYFVEALEQAAQELGFGAQDARKLALETFTGAVKLATESDENIAALRAKVTSKGGTTERALQTMEAAGVKQSIVQAIHAAAQRSREMARDVGKD
jgi:pyrroline-5-carboxylate reductase